MSVQKTVFLISLLCVPCVVGVAESHPTNRWEAKAHKEDITDIQRKTYQQLARLHDFEGFQLDNWGTMDYLMVRRPNPMINLREMGIRVLPMLVEALDDSTPSKTVTRSGSSTTTPHRTHVWKVNELVARLIRDLTNHEFVLGDWQSGVSLYDVESHRDRIPEFQKEVLRWYKENKDKTPEDRKIAALDDNLHNRLDAARWLGKKKSIKAVPFLAKRVDAILRGKEESSSTQTELAEISLALGRIGDPKGLPVVQKACDHLSDVLPRSPGSSAVQELFTAFEGLALLGHKKDALAELNHIYSEFRPRMEILRKKEFEERLSEAEKW
jgi:hypothetical protein